MQTKKTLKNLFQIVMHIHVMCAVYKHAQVDDNQNNNADYRSVFVLLKILKTLLMLHWQSVYLLHHYDQ